MKSLHLLLLALFLVPSCLVGQTVVSPPQKTRVLLILNCSNSMWDHWQSDAKIKVTQQVLLRFLDSIAGQPDIEVALRVFGHLNKGSYSTRLEVPFAADNLYRLKSKIKTLVPNGGNTTATALTESLNDFPPSDNYRNIIVIITDGIDDSDGDICQVARRVQLSGIIVQTFILGIGNPDDFRHSLDCAGNFAYLPDEADYTRALYDVFQRSEAKAGVVVQLLDADGMPCEGSHTVAFYDAQTGVVKYTALFNGDSRDDNDTLWIDPLTDYDVAVYTRPETWQRGLRFQGGSVHSVPMTVNEGTLTLRRDGIRTTWAVPPCDVVVRQHGGSDEVCSLTSNQRGTLLAGNYDLEVRSCPPLHIDNVEVRQGQSTEITLPMPGLLTVSKPKTLVEGTLFCLVEGKLRWVCDLNPNLVSERLVLQPGEYQVVYRPVVSSKQTAVKNIRFQITSAKQTNVSL